MKLVYRDSKGAPLTNGEVDSNFNIASKYLETIEETKSVNAVDVFVYDTSKDSDGGAWRHRTQHTSWYNEPLNTSTRGSRKEFPAVAVIVAESTKVTIYDGDDPSIPMWAVVNKTSYGWGWQNYSGIAAFNGFIYLGSTSSGLFEWNFIQDEAWMTDSASRRRFPVNFANRNVTGTAFAETDTSFNIVNTAVNDVAMTVLPDAPIDQATQLPIPTIAVATDGGVSVIKDDGTVVDSGVTFKHTHVAFKGSTFYYATDSSGGTARRVDDVATLSDGFNPDKEYNYGQIPYITQKKDGYNSTSYPTPMEGNVIASYSNYGAHSAFVITDPDMNASTAGTTDLLARIQKDYNTGWMNGDIKLATLSDTDDTDLVGSELVTNGTFDTDTTGWSAGVYGATLSVNSGALRITNGGNVNGRAISDEFNTTIGKTYVVSVTGVAKSSATYRLEVRSGVEKVRTWSTEGETVYVTFTAVQSTTFIELYAIGGASGPYVEYDNISVRLAEPDRSVNNNGLQVFGTVQKSPVATGADLMAYSGFSPSNYLRQPRNPDLDFGTGDFCVMGWVKPKTGATQTIASYGDSSLTSGHMWFGVLSQNTVRLWLGETGYDSNITTTQTVNIDTWNHLVAYRKSGVVYIFINGQLSTSGTLSNDFSNNIGYASVGVAPDNTASYSTTYYSLLRISGTAPTAEQIKKIYEDEKVLFQENAKATLHGTSDAVTALAYDDTTELLHVGTSAGRSVFQGLRRVDNTTDAVGVAISASNGLVVEE